MKKQTQGQGMAWRDKALIAAVVVVVLAVVGALVARAATVGTVPSDFPPTQKQVEYGPAAQAPDTAVGPRVDIYTFARLIEGPAVTASIYKVDVPAGGVSITIDSRTIAWMAKAHRVAVTATDTGDSYVLSTLGIAAAAAGKGIEIKNGEEYRPPTGPHLGATQVVYVFPRRSVGTLGIVEEKR